MRGTMYSVYIHILSYCLYDMKAARLSIINIIMKNKVINRYTLAMVSFMTLYHWCADQFQIYFNLPCVFEKTPRGVLLQRGSTVPQSH